MSPSLYGNNRSAFGAAAQGFSALLSDQGGRRSGFQAKGDLGGAGVEADIGAALEQAGQTGAGPSPADVALNMPPGFSDHTWGFWGESAAKNGFVGTTALIGQPNNYTYTGDIITLEKNRGRPWSYSGVVQGVTKTGGGRIKGDMSRSKNYTYFSGRMRDIQLALEKGFGVPWNAGENLTGETDSANTNEITLMGVLFCYGGIPHRYPRSIDELCAHVGISPVDIYTGQLAHTPGANSWSTPVIMSTALAETGWWDAASVYYVLGFKPHLVNTCGFLNLINNLPPYWKARQATIPFGHGAEPVTFDGDVLCLPYEPIGPFSGVALPYISMLGSAATATTGELVIAKV